MDSARTVAGEGTSRAKSRKSGRSRAFVSRPPFACGLALIRSSPSGFACGRGRPEHRTSRRAPRAVGLHPRVEDREVGVVAFDPREGDLVGAPCPGDLDAVDLGRTGPALRRAQDDERPPRSGSVPVPRPGLLLDLPDPSVCRRERLSEALVHPGDVSALDLVDVVAVALEQGAHLGTRFAAEHCRPGDLGPVEVQDRQHRAVTDRVEERDTLPRALQRTRLGLTVADDRDGEQVGVVHHRTEGVDEHIAELTALVDRPRRGHGDMARDAAGRGELPEQPVDAALVERDVRIDLGVGPLEVPGRDERRAAVARSGEIDHLLLRVADDAREMGVDEGQARARAPVPEQPRLDVLGGQRLAQEWVALQVDLADGQEVVCPPPGVHRSDLCSRRGRDGELAGRWSPHHCLGASVPAQGFSPVLAGPRARKRAGPPREPGSPTDRISG